MYVIVQGGDTLASLAQKYLGSEDQATQLISANQLDPPFISQDQSFVPSAAATGTVTFTLTGSGPVTISAGTEVQTVGSSSGNVRSYTTASAVTLNSSGNTATVNVTCTVPGPLGNVAPNTINSVVGYSGVSVANNSSLTGGYYLHVLLPGDRIWIPDPSITTPSSTQTLRQPLIHYDLAGGTGLLVTPTGGLAWGATDLKLTQGSDTIGQEVANRLRTPRGQLFYDSLSGSLVPSLKGGTSTDTLAQAAILAQADALQDDRLSDAEFIVSPYADGWLVLNGTLVLKTGITVQLPIPIT